MPTQKRTGGAILFALFLALAPAMAGAEEASGVLTWQDCVGLAVRGNPTLLAAVQSMEASHSAYKGSFNGILPQLSLANTYTESSSSHIGVGNNGVSSIISDDSKVWTLSGNASIDLVDFGQWSSIQNALAQYHQSQASLKSAANNTLLSLYQAFAALMYSQEEVDVNALIRDTWRCECADGRAAL